MAISACGTVSQKDTQYIGAHLLVEYQVSVACKGLLFAARLIFKRYLVHWNSPFSRRFYILVYKLAVSLYHTCLSVKIILPMGDHLFHLQTNWVSASESIWIIYCGCWKFSAAVSLIIWLNIQWNRCQTFSWTLRYSPLAPISPTPFDDIDTLYLSRTGIPTVTPQNRKSPRVRAKGEKAHGPSWLRGSSLSLFNCRTLLARACKRSHAGRFSQRQFNERPDFNSHFRTAGLVFPPALLAWPCCVSYTGLIKLQDPLLTLMKTVLPSESPRLHPPCQNTLFSACFSGLSLDRKSVV